jgi:hypothetical protein
MPESLTITDGQYKDIQEGISQITIPDEIMEALFNLRTVCSKRFDSRDDIDDVETGVPYVSDRRWKKIVGVLRASAYLNGRSEVDFSDCLLLEHMIWDKDAQMNMIKKDIAKMVTDGAVTWRPSSSRTQSGKDQLQTTDDGKFYIVIAGTDEFYITPEDYDKLSGGKLTYGRFTSGNRILVDSQSGDFRMKSDSFGTLSMNSFKYQLKKVPSKNANALDDLVSIPERLKMQIKENLFLRDTLESYPQLNSMTNKYKGYSK